MSISKDAIQIK